MSITIQIDGKTCTCEPGEHLLDIALRNEISIPALCGRKPYLQERACCRVCIAEVVEDGHSKVVTSCIYPIEHECEVFTQSDKIVRERGVVLAFLKLLAPDAKLVAQLAKAYKAPELSRLEPNEKGGTCILCGRCIDACALLGTNAIAAMSRGVEKEVNTAYGAAAPACIGCKSCAALCPTDTIAVEEDEDCLTIWSQTFELAHCEACGEPLGTVASLKHAAEVAGEEMVLRCPEHRQKSIADSFAQIYRR